jgi:hypothetical protein
MQKIVVIMILVVEIFYKSNPNSYYLNIDFAYAKIIFAYAYDAYPFAHLLRFPQVSHYRFHFSFE